MLIEAKDDEPKKQVDLNRPPEPLNDDDRAFIEATFKFYTLLNAPAEVLALVRSELERNPPSWSFEDKDEYNTYTANLYLDAFKHLRGYAPVLESESDLRRPSVLGRTPPQHLRYRQQAFQYLSQIFDQAKSQAEIDQARAIFERIRADSSFAQQFVEEMQRTQQAKQQPKKKHFWQR